MCCNDDNNSNSIGTRNNSISLKELLKYYFNYNSDLKDEIHGLMSSKPYLWKTRPLTEKLINYAGSDVQYLPKIYDTICMNCEKKCYKNVTIEKIMEECKRYLKYIDINKHIKNFGRTNLKPGTKLFGLIKNFQNKCVYIQLNIGYIGIVNDLNSILLLQNNHNLGDIIEFYVTKVEKGKKRLILEIYNSSKEKAILEEEKNKNYDSNNKLPHESLKINKNSFYPKSYYLHKYHNSMSFSNNDIQNIDNNQTNYNYFFNGNEYYNNMNNINYQNLPINKMYYNITNLNNNGWLCKDENNNAYYFEQSGENSPNNDFYYIINKFQEKNQTKYSRQYK